MDAIHRHCDQIDAVRIASTQDAGAVAAIYAPYVTDTVISFELAPPGAADMGSRIAYILPKFPWLVFVRDGALLGYAYASPHRERAAYQWSVDTTVYVAPQAHRMGVGRTLYAVLNRILRLQGYRMALAGIALPNDASVGLHEAIGFAPIGIYRNIGFKLGAWRDVGWWGLELGADNAQPIQAKDFSVSLFARAVDALRESPVS